MASLIRDPNGRKRIQWCVGGDERRTLRLGAVSVKQAEAVRLRVEQLLATKITGVMDPEAAAWVGGLDDDFHGKLAHLGLIPSRERAAPTLGRLLDEFFATLNVKPGTRIAYGQVRRSLEAYFDPDRPLRTISVLDAEKWRRSLVDEGLAGPTIAKRVKVARQVFGCALRWKMLGESPFSHLRAGPMHNRARMYFVTRESLGKLLEAAADRHWRLVILLSRIGGLRVPSETRELRWADIDFHRCLIHVRSCKTEGYEGKDRRMVPMFPELRRPLLDAFEQAPEGEEFVLPSPLCPAGNLRTTMLKVIRRAGLVAWPKPFHNMRSSRQTELADEFPAHAVCAWLGNSVSVAMNSYLQVTDQHLARAIAGTGGVGAQPAAVGDDGAGGRERHPGQRDANGANLAATKDGPEQTAA